MKTIQPTFLTAQWRKLLIANYLIDPERLRPYLPPGVELDYFQGECLVSLVGFLFDRVRVRGLAVPGHTRFPEINLRFYVKQRTPEGWRRGVVFVKELVPRRAIAWVARLLYGEPYEAVPINYSWQQQKEALEVNYSWHYGSWMHLSARVTQPPRDFAAGSLEEFITEHYWGYTRRRGGKTQSYEVEHPSWAVYPIEHYAINANMEALYGPDFAAIDARHPHSVLLAEGSEVRVRRGELWQN